MDFITDVERREVLRHYWRMRKWAKTQDPKGSVDISNMDHTIGEDWSAVDCVLCTRYGRDVAAGYSCSNCPLALNGYRCEEIGSPWNDLSSANTWEEWILGVKYMTRVIVELPREKRYE